MVEVKCRVKWNGPALVRAVDKGVNANLAEAGKAYKQQVVANITAFQGHKGDHSLPPSQFPYRQSGDLAKSIEMEHDRTAKVVRVGSMLDYARFLELGTRKMVMRPFLRRTLAEMVNILSMIIGRKLP